MSVLVIRKLVSLFDGVKTPSNSVATVATSIAIHLSLDIIGAVAAAPVTLAYRLTTITQGMICKELLLFKALLDRSVG
jgi:hypothetical protein